VSDARRDDRRSYDPSSPDVIAQRCSGAGRLPARRLEEALHFEGSRLSALALEYESAAFAGAVEEPGLAVSVILTLGVPAAHDVTAHTCPAHVAGYATSVTACGVERWAVKTGMDPDARVVNQKVVVPTTIIHLRSLPAPMYLPVRSRLRPVETTVWGIDAILLRYKVEEDSDVHLVIADTGGRTMISEIPAPCPAGMACQPAARRRRGPAVSKPRSAA
jgi:hypothetical protein